MDDHLSVSPVTAESPPEDYRYSDEIKAEYLALQGFFEDYDKRALSLKTLATPLLGVGIAAGLKEESVSVLGAAMAVALCLWILEAVWKSFQYRHADRIVLIEKSYRENKLQNIGAPFQIYASWAAAGARYNADFKLWRRHFLAPFVMLPYVVILVIAYVGAVTILVNRDAGRPVHGQVVQQAPSPPIDGAIRSIPAYPPQCTVPALSCPGPIDPPRSPLAPLWLVMTLAIAIVGGAIWLATLFLRHAKLVRVTQGDAAIDGELATIAKQASGVTVIAALTAFGTAMAAVGKVGDGWKLVLPLLIAPAGMFAAVQVERTRHLKWWAFMAGVIISLAIAVSHLVDRTVRYLPGRWWTSFQTNATHLVAKLTFADEAALFVALLAYFVSIGGASLTGRPATGGRITTAASS